MAGEGPLGEESSAASLSTHPAASKNSSRPMWIYFGILMNLAGWGGGLKIFFF